MYVSHVTICVLRLPRQFFIAGESTMRGNTLVMI
jgi:hypothetical protein